MEHSREEIEALAEFYDHTDTTALDSEEVTLEPVTDPMVSRSVRMRLDGMERLRVIARRDGIGVTALMRQWVLERLELEEHPQQPNPHPLSATCGSVVINMLPNGLPSSGVNMEHVAAAFQAGYRQRGMMM